MMIQNFKNMGQIDGWFPQLINKAKLVGGSHKDIPPPRP